MKPAVIPLLMGLFIGGGTALVVAPARPAGVAAPPQAPLDQEAPVRTPTGQSAPGPMEPPASEAFTWASVESADDAQLGANLRRVGCPEKTVHAIIRARILLRFRERAQRLQNPMAKHWSTFEERKAHADERAKIRAEQDQLLADLGVPPTVNAAAHPPTRTSQLSPEKLQHIADITARYPNELLSITATPEEITQKFKNRKARLECLAQYLTPEELRTYRLEQDSNVKTVEMLLRPISLTPEELDKVAFALDFNQGIIHQGHLPPEVEKVLQEGLSSERYAEYLEMFSPSNATFSQFIIMDQTSSEEVRMLKSIRQQNLSPEALKAALTEVLGETRAAQYLKHTQPRRPQSKR